MLLNPNSSKDYVNGYSSKPLAEKVHMYSQFFCGIEFETFRHIRNLTIQFVNPITVISGSNKSGKTSILLTTACSHYNFLKKDYSKDEFKRTTWGQIMKFTNYDEQRRDWTYYVSYRIGNQEPVRKRGQRKYETKKWNGVAKKESQIGTPVNGINVGRKVYLIDLDRIVPARKLSSATFKNACDSVINPLQNTIIDYVSYIIEREYNVGVLYANADNEVFGYENGGYKYSSYNTASGEDVLTRIIEDIVNADEGSLILIEEIEIGLHPKIQRRLMDVLYIESKRAKKQFIVTTHSSSVLASVQPESRIFIENNTDSFRVISNISINAALTKMDSFSYPLIDIYVEDDISRKLINKAVDKITEERPGFCRLVNLVVVGSADKTYNYFKTRNALYNEESINAGYACVLDGDMREKKSGNKLQYPPEELLYFHYSNDAPEKMLLKAYLQASPNNALQYHCVKSDPHCLFEKMIEEGVCTDKDRAFEMCWNALIETQEGQLYLEDMKNFIKNACIKFSADL